MAAEGEGSDCSAPDGQVGAGGHDAVNAELSRLAAPHVAEFLPGVKLLQVRSSPATCLKRQAKLHTSGLTQVPEPTHVGQEVWSSGQVFAAFASSCFEAGYWKGKRVLEVGAGLGGVSLALAGLGATVLATDAAEPASVLEGLRRNVEREERVMVVRACCAGRLTSQGAARGLHSNTTARRSDTATTVLASRGRARPGHEPLQTLP